MASYSYSQSSNIGTTQGTSTPAVLQSPQALLEQQIAQYAAQLTQQQYQWGLQQYANTSAMTNETADNFLATSQQDMAMANQSANQYYNVTSPEITQQANMAAQYTSPSRVGINMGAAESGQQQAANSALQAAKQNLQSYGINPSSGEYAELQQASKTAAGAAAAGAGQQAELATEATGRQLLAQSIATGQQLPGQSINAANAGVVAGQAAENSSLANANTGVNLTDTGPTGSLSSAMNLKYPAIGNTSQNTSTQMGQATSQSANYGSGSSGSGSGGSYSSRFTSNTGPGLSPGGYAGGGDIGNDGTEGGFVNRSASPSNGVNVDDVPANLNAEEFVIPRDVARWKGEEFWHKEIAKSRAARAKAAATVGPTVGPPAAPGQQPTFTSQSVEHGGSISARRNLRNLQMDEFLNQRHM